MNIYIQFRLIFSPEELTMKIKALYFVLTQGKLRYARIIYTVE